MRAIKRFLKCCGAIAAIFVMSGGFAAANEPPVLLVYGDSLSAAHGLNAADGWVALLQGRISQRQLAWRVVNASVSGETTAGGLARLQRTLDEHKPSLVLLELGPNDGLRGLPIDRMRANLDTMVEQIRKARATPVVLGMQLPPNFGIDYTREFAATYRLLSEREKLPLVPFLLEGIVERREWFQADNLHPTREAQPIILETVWKTLEPLLKSRPGRARS